MDRILERLARVGGARPRGRAVGNQVDQQQVGLHALQPRLHSARRRAVANLRQRDHGVIAPGRREVADRLGKLPAQLVQRPEQERVQRHAEQGARVGARLHDAHRGLSHGQHRPVRLDQPQMGMRAGRDERQARHAGGRAPGHWRPPWRAPRHLSWCGPSTPPSTDSRGAARRVAMAASPVGWPVAYPPPGREARCGAPAQRRPGRAGGLSRFRPGPDPAGAPCLSGRCARVPSGAGARAPCSCRPQRSVAGRHGPCRC